MRTLKKSLFRVPIFWFMIWLYSLPTYFYWGKGLGNLTIYLCFVGFITLVFAILSIAFGYIVTLDDRIIIKNAIYPFYKATYPYKEIQEIEFCHAYRGGIYLKIHLNHSKVHSHAIECVDKKQLKELAGIFRLNKIPVTLQGPIIKEYFSD